MANAESEHGQEELKFFNKYTPFLIKQILWSRLQRQTAKLVSQPLNCVPPLTKVLLSGMTRQKVLIT